MKPFLGVERTNEYRNCKDYAIRCTSKETQQEWTDVFNKREAMLRKRHLAKFAYYLSLCMLIIGIATLFQALTFLKNNEGVFNVSLFLLNLFVSVLCFCIYFFIRHHYKTKHKVLVEMAKKSDLNIRRDLKIPNEVGFTEVIFYHYEVRNNELVPVSENPKSPVFFNPLYYLYVENDCLNIGTDKEVFAVPLCALKKIKKVEQKIAFRFWKKPEHFASPAYKNFPIVAAKNAIEMDYYYTLELFLDDEMWEIPFPCYELPVFEKLTGLRAATE